MSGIGGRCCILPTMHVDVVYTRDTLVITQRQWLTGTAAAERRVAVGLTPLLHSHLTVKTNWQNNRHACSCSVRLIDCIFTGPFIVYWSNRGLHTSLIKNIFLDFRLRFHCYFVVNIILVIVFVKMAVSMPFTTEKKRYLRAKRDREYAEDSADDTQTVSETVWPSASACNSRKGRMRRRRTEA